MIRQVIAGIVLLLCTASGMAWGGTPDWVKAAAAATVPPLPGEPRGVVLLDETTTTVSGTGEIRALHRIVWKILTTSGRALGEFAVRSDAETRLKSLHAWTITAHGEEMQAGDRDAIETSVVPGELYSDQKLTVLRIPGAEPGSIVAVEFERRGRPYALQDSWTVQAGEPVILARYAVVLPDGWSHDEKWFHSEGVAPARAGNTTVWEMHGVAALKVEEHRPQYGAIAARMSINFIPPREQLAGKTHRTWNDVAAW